MERPSAPVPVAGGADAPTLHAFQDASGRLHAVFGHGDAAGLHLVYASSDNGTAWRTSSVATQSPPVGIADTRVATAADHVGVAVYRAGNPVGEIRVAPVGPTTAGGAADRLAPSLSKPKLSRKRFRVGPKPTAKRQRAAGSAQGDPTVTYVLSEAATVSAGIDRKLKGRTVKRKGRKAKCLRETRRNRKGHKRCTLYKKAGTLTRQGALGKNSFAFSGRIGKKKLAAASYQLTLTPTDRARNTGKARTLRFQIVR